MKMFFKIIIIIAFFPAVNVVANDVYFPFDSPYLKSAPAQVWSAVTINGVTTFYWQQFTCDWEIETGPVGGGHSQSDVFIFDGNNSWVDGGNYAPSDIGTKDFNISFWFKTSSSRYVMAIIDKRENEHFGNGYLVVIYNNTILLQMSSPIYGWRNYYSSSDHTIRDNKWHKVDIYVTRNSTTGGVMYLDGDLIYTFNPTQFQNANITSSANVLIGAHSVKSSSDFIGSLDDIRIMSE